MLLAILKVGKRAFKYEPLAGKRRLRNDFFAQSLRYAQNFILKAMKLFP